MMNKKSVVIFGATSDIAIAIVREFADQGYDLFLAARNVDRLHSLSFDLNLRFGTTVELLEFDGLDYESHEKLVNQLPDHCTIAICVFGLLGDQESAQSDWKQTERIINVNFTGAVSVLNQVANCWEGKGEGVIVGVSSVAGDRGRGSNYIYGSAKAGLTTYLAGLRNRLSVKGVHVVTVKPGFVYTKMTNHLDLPVSLTSSSEDVAKKIFYAIRKSKNVIYVGFVWRYIMMIIKLIPEPIFKKLKL